MFIFKVMCKNVLPVSAGSSLSLSWVPQPLLKELKLLKQLWALSSARASALGCFTLALSATAPRHRFKGSIPSSLCVTSRTDPTGA